MHADGQVLGHFTVFYGLDGGCFEGVAEVGQLWLVVELGAVEEATGPGEDTGDGVGGGFSSLLVLSVVTGHGSVSGLSLNSTIRSVKHRGHQSQRSITYISQVLP